MTPKKVFITGGTGTFGKEFTNYLLKKKNIKKIVVYSRDELKQSQMKQQLKNFESRLRFLIGDVRDLQRLENCVADCDTIVHAAAMKRVEVCEQNPIEAIKTNIYGSENVISAALNNSFVKKSILISTDKAVNPINLYGATKLASDKLFIAANNLIGKAKTRFSIVRYGNVLNSRGSVVPFFKSLSNNNNKYFPITHPSMTRFWIILDDAIKFVDFCIRNMAGGEIFVPKIPSVKIVDLAKAINPHMKIKIIGIKPGEKLHEIMCPRDSAHLTYEYKNHYIIKPVVYSNVNTSDKNKGKKVQDNFEYNSFSNKDFLNISQIKKIL